ncbi:hypothetical protein RZS08_45545, partial [Arthrospira platensis SPKY1]|nr:hypothetical protein [Arthrospira platensis SPKY1]
KPFPKTKKAQDRLNSEYDKIVYDLVDTINARSTVKYDVVSKKYQLHESNNDLLLVWLMPQKQLTKLRQLSSNKRGIELESWDFPWR